MSSARLKVIAGRQKGTVWPLADGRFTLGRDPQCEFVLDDDVASRRHAEILVSGTRVAIRDLHSTNHTYVNRGQIDKVELADGDVFQIGDTRVEVSTRARSPAMRAKERPAAPAKKRAAPRAKSSPAPSARRERRVAAAAPKASALSGRRIVVVALIGVVVLGAVLVTLGRGGRAPQQSGSESGTRTPPQQQRAQPPQVAATTLAELPDNLRQLYDQGLTHFQYGNLVRARSSFERVVASYPGFREGTRSLGRVNDLVDEKLDRAFARARSAVDAGRSEELRSAIETINFLAKPDDPRRQEAQALTGQLPER